MSKSNIEWTDETWNPIRGCSMAPGSEKGGCLNCYAARDAARKEFNPKLPEFRGYAIFKDTGPRWTGMVDLIEKKLFEPMFWKRPRKVFVNSMSDAFHEELSAHEILAVFQVMAKCQRHRFQILTKRSSRLPELLTPWHWRNLGFSPALGGDHYVKVVDGFKSVVDVNYLPNVHLGVSIENPETAERRIPDLLNTPAALRFISYEPALAAVKLRDKWLYGGCRPTVDLGPKAGKLDWVIIGGESGPHARPFNLKWARDTIRDMCSVESSRRLCVPAIGTREEATRAASGFRRGSCA